jgi:hypothetical protein
MRYNNISTTKPNDGCTYPSRSLDGSLYSRFGNCRLSTL